MPAIVRKTPARGAQAILAVALLFGITATQAETLPSVEWQKPLTGDAEKTLAKQIHDECSRILELVPRLSPAEKSWLDGEIQAKRDVINLLSRPETARNTLFIYFSDCTYQTQRVLESKSARDRATSWARLVSRFAAAIDLAHDGKWAAAADLEAPVVKFAAWARLSEFGILDSAVIPYLDGRVQDSTQ
jgi:hypothetical protein